jgi:hypothetical protein
MTEDRKESRDSALTRRQVVIGGGALAAGLAGGAAAGFGIARATEDDGGAVEVAKTARVFAKPEGTTLKVFGTELGTPWYDQTPFVTPTSSFSSATAIPRLPSAPTRGSSR